MKKWIAIVVLAFAQFVMVLDSTVMNVSISTVVKDLDTTVTAMQGAITFYTLTMASLMLLGGKLGDVWGRKRALIIGSVVYALGSLITGLSTSFGMLFVGWSVIEGLGAVLIIPAVAALVATNYQGKDRVKAYAVIGAVSGAAAAAGPLIGGFVTTYLDWRYVFFAEVAIMAGVLLFTKHIADAPRAKKVPKIDIPSVVLSAGGLVLLVFGMLQSSKWGWIEPRAVPQVAGHNIDPFGISIVAFLILAGVIILRTFYLRQQQLEAAGKNPLVKASLFKLPVLRSGLGVLLAQYLVIGAVFFVMPVYLQMTLGLDALETGVKIFPLSVAIILASVAGTRLSNTRTPKRIIRIGQVLLVIGVLVLLGSINIDLKGFYFGTGMFILGFGLGLLVSQIGNINMSSVAERDTSEVGGLQGVFQNLGSSMGTAIIGSILVGALTTSFIANIQTSSLPGNVKTYVQDNSNQGVSIVPVSEVSSYAASKGLSPSEVNEAVEAYSESQIQALKNALFALFVIAFLSLLFSRNIPNKVLK
jgi:EmrB/QacA subfamily drug resistance transporter